MKKFCCVHLPTCLTIILITACATTLDVPTDERTRVFDASYSETFRAVIQVLSEEGYLMDNTDRENGVITTDYTEISTSSGIFARSERTKVSAVIREMNTGTQIRLTMSVQSHDSTGWDAVGMNKREARSYYTRLFDQINDNLEE